MDSTAQTAPKDSEIIKELLSRVTHGFDTPHLPRHSDIMNEQLSRVRLGFDSPNSHYGLRYHQ